MAIVRISFTRARPFKAETELQSSADRLRDRAGKLADPAGDPQDEQHDAEHDPGGGDLAGFQPVRQDHGRHGLHGLNR